MVPEDDSYQRPKVAEFNYIDKLVHEKLNKLRVIPSKLASDEVFLRRVFLDIVGLPPSPEERRKFLDDTREDKRGLQVDGCSSGGSVVSYCDDAGLAEVESAYPAVDVVGEPFHDAAGLGEALDITIQLVRDLNLSLVHAGESAAVEI